MGLLGTSSVHRRWYGPKPPAAMISGKRDVSGETEVENRGAKVCSVWYIFYVTILKSNQRFRTRIKLVLHIALGSHLVNRKTAIVVKMTLHVGINKK